MAGIHCGCSAGRIWYVVEPPVSPSYEDLLAMAVEVRERVERLEAGNAGLRHPGGELVELVQTSVVGRVGRAASDDGQGQRPVSG